MATIREDVIKVSFDIDDSPLSNAQKGLDNLTKSVKGNLGKDAFSGLTDGAKEAGNSVDGAASKMKTAMKGVSSETNNTSTKVQGIIPKLKQVASVGMQKLSSGLKTVGTHLTNIAKKAGGAAYNGLKKLAGISFKALAAGLAGAATGIGVILKQSVSSYADYEQLVGGVETLFKDNAGTVQKYAKDAYMTAGISANKYMDTVTSFSASMISSLGGDTAKAAELSNTALIDMSDNANKMGTDMETIIGTYQSLAKGNFAMLDNLKLGYGGTKTEMERLIKDASKLDSSVKANDMSFANMVKALHAVQTNLDITGTTSKEASTTITGSANAMKASWENMLTAIVSGEDFDTYLNNFISSAETFGSNLLPALEKGLQGIGTLIERISPHIQEAIPKLTQTLLPSFIEAATGIVTGLIQALPGIISTLVAELPGMFSTIGETISTTFSEQCPALAEFGQKFSENADKITGAIPYIVAGVAAFKGFKIVKGLATSISTFAKGIGSIAQKVGGGLAGKLTATGAGMTTTGTAASTSGTQVGTAATSFMKFGVAILAIGGGLALAGVGFALLAQSAIALANAGGGAIAVMAGLVVVIAALAFGASLIGPALTAGAVGFLAFGAAMLMCGGAAVLIATAVNMITPPILQLIPAITQAVTTIVNLWGTVLVNAIQTAGTAIQGILQGVGDIFTSFGEAVSNIVTSIGDAISGVLDSIAGIFDSIGNAAKNAGVGFEKAANGLKTISSLSIGDLVKSLGALGDGLGELSKHSAEISQTGQGMQSLVTALASISTAAVSASTALTVIVQMATQMSTAFTAVGTAVTAFATTLTGLTASFTSVVAPMQTITSQFTQLSQAFATIGSSALVFAASMVVLLAAFTPLTPVTTAFSTALATMPPVLTACVSGMTMINTLSTMILSSFTALVPLVTTLTTAFSPMASGLTVVAVAMLGTLAPLAMVTAQFAVLASATSIVATASTVTVSAFTAMGTAATAAGNAIVALMATMTALMANMSNVQSAIKALEKTFKSCMNGMVSAVKSGGQSMVASMRSTMTQLAAAVQSANLQSSGANLINGLINGMNSRKAAAVSTARSIAQAINAEFDKIQDINSPSGVWEDKGKYLIEGGIVGMEKQMPKLQDTTREAAEISIPYVGDYTSEKAATYTNTRTNTIENNSYAPVFNFNISGGGDVKATARAVKKAARQALQEMIESMDRRNPKLTEY